MVKFVILLPENHIRSRSKSGENGDRKGTGKAPERYRKGTGKGPERVRSEQTTHFDNDYARIISSFIFPFFIY